MSIHGETRASEIERCLSSLARQTLPAAEVILVRDGPVDSSVERSIGVYESMIPFRHVHFPRNRGLGPALRDGLKACNHDLVARVDSDDWSISNRFQCQVEFLCRKSNISAVGSVMKETYNHAGKEISVVRKIPLDNASIQRVAKRRNPMNHPTVMFRKSHVLASGNYESCPLFEDYFLWAKMLTQGYILSNLPEVLVETEVDLDYFQRRGGLTYVKNELNLAQKLRKIEFLSFFETTFFLLSRIPVRLAPVFIRKYLYRILLRSQ
jgi:glycosyltransferase involved in cell wall biosynthesis